MIRKNVSHLRDEVWEFRNHRDAYARTTKFEDALNVDHVLELQLASFASLDDPAVLPLTRDVFNGDINLNATSKRINQAKRGPFTAAINRLTKRDGSLREISAEQLARNGRARWLVDEGVWARIEREVVASYDGADEELKTRRLTRAQCKKIEEGMDRLHDALSKIKIM